MRGSDVDGRVSTCWLVPNPYVNQESIPDSITISTTITAQQCNQYTTITAQQCSQYTIITAQQSTTGRMQYTQLARTECR